MSKNKSKKDVKKNSHRRIRYKPHYRIRNREGDGGDSPGFIFIESGDYLEYEDITTIGEP